MLSEFFLATRPATCFVLLLLAGCGGGPSRVVPEYPASDSGAAAVKLLDANSDGVLQIAETDKAPGLKAAFKEVDADQDQKLSAAEIDQRIKRWADSKVGRMSATLVINFNGAPLANAEVKLVPESFQGTTLPTATGTTNAAGFVTPSAPESKDKHPGVPPGFYRVEVTGPNIPAKFNTETTLGLEVAPQSTALMSGPVTLELK